PERAVASLLGQASRYPGEGAGRGVWSLVSTYSVSSHRVRRGIARSRLLHLQSQLPWSNSLLLRLSLLQPESYSRLVTSPPRSRQARWEVKASALEHFALASFDETNFLHGA